MPFARNGDLKIYFETFGFDDRPSAPCLVLVNGLGNQCISFRDELCMMFVSAGARVVRFDNRDVGLSSDGPDGYTLTDMASDAVCVLDEIGVTKAHFLGVSLGGMIVQTLAIEFPGRVASCISVMSTTGRPDVGRPTDEARRLLLTPGTNDRDQAIVAHLEGQRVWGSPGLVEWDVQREQAGAAYDRACRPAGTARQYQAARRSGDRDERLRRVNVPFHVVHGSADTLIDQSGGRHTAAVVPGARLTIIEGMGHDYPRHYWPDLVDIVRRWSLPISVGG